MKSPVMILLCLIIPLFVISAIITGIKAPALPPVNLQTNDFHQALVNFEHGDPERIPYARDAIDAPLIELYYLIFATDGDFTTVLRDSFNIFADTWNEFLTLRLDDRDYDEFMGLYRGFFLAVNHSFLVFEAEVNAVFAATSRVLITPANYRIIRQWMDETSSVIERDPAFDVNTLLESDLDQKRLGLQLAWDRHAHRGEVEDRQEALERHGVYRALHNSTSITFTEAQRATLVNIYSNIIVPNQIELVRQVHDASDFSERREAIARYKDYIQSACDYLNEHIRQMQARNTTSNIRQFQGFTTFNNAATRDRMAVLGVLVREGKATFDYSIPYRFGGVLNRMTGTTPYDFIFNNLELITIPLIILASLIVLFCILDDIKKNTVLTALMTPRGRRRVIISKLFACTIAIAAIISIFTFLFFATAVIVTGGVSVPPVLLAFGGRPYVMSPFTLLFIYVMSLFFKILFFSTITALFCVGAEDYRDVIVRAAIAIVAIIALNFIFSVLLSFVFYQYLPLLGLDFAGYFGIRFMLSRHIASTFIWFTLPVMILVWICMIATIVVRFERRDF